MRIKFWGCRGSIPVPDPRMAACGGNTSCIEVTLNGRTLIIDAGTGIRRLGDDLARRDVTDIDLLVTHSHWDHIQGFPFFRQVYSEKSSINLLGCPRSCGQLKKALEHQMSHGYFPVSFNDLRSRIRFVESAGGPYAGGTLRFIETNHPLCTLGLRLEENGKSFVFITDNELGAKAPATSLEEFAAFCRDADYLIHDAQFTQAEYPEHEGWGHSTFEQAQALARAANVRNLGFFHHDPDRTDDELAALEREARLRRDRDGDGFEVFVTRELDAFEW